MTRGAIALMAVSAAALLPGGVLAAGEATPRLTRVSQTPLVVQASGFAPGERVTVTAVGARAFKPRTVHANARGRFRIQLALRAPCGSPIVLRARGSHGDTAVLALPPVPCVPPPRD